jgi:hypothetical protein
LARARKAREDRANAEKVEAQRAAEVERQRRDSELARREAEAARQRAAIPAPQPAAASRTAEPPKQELSVKQTCAGRNFVAEQVCMINECRKSARASDTTCVKFKQMEEESRRREQVQ